LPRPQKAACRLRRSGLDIYIHVGGEVVRFDAGARSIMEWRLRSSGYAEKDVAPDCWTSGRAAVGRKSI
jgi:hypothetical protein